MKSGGFQRGKQSWFPPLVCFSSPILFSNQKRIGPAEHDGTNYRRIVPYFTASTLRGPILFACPKRIGRKRTFKGRALYKTLSGLPLSLPASLRLRQGKRLPSFFAPLTPPQAAVARSPLKNPLLRNLRQFLANAWAGCPDPAPAGVVRVISIELHYTLVRTITHGLCYARLPSPGR